MPTTVRAFVGEQTANSEMFASIPLTPSSSASVHLKKFTRDFSGFLDTISARMENVDSQRLTELYNVSRGVSAQQRASMSFGSGETTGALQRDVDAPIKVPRQLQPNVAPADVDVLAGTVPPSARPGLEASTKSEAVSAAFPVLSVTSLAPISSSDQPDGTPDPLSDVTADATRPADRATSGTPQKACAEDGPRAMDESFRDTSYGRNEGDEAAQKAEACRRYLQHMRRLLVDPAVDPQVRNTYVDELVKASLQLFELTETLYGNVAFADTSSQEPSFAGGESNMVPVLAVPDSPSYPDLTGGNLMPARIATVSNPTALREFTSSVLVTSRQNAQFPGLLDSFCGGQSIHFVRNRRESCPSYADGSTTSFNSGAMEALNQYYVMKRLGTGTTASVSLCMDRRTRQFFAVKSMALPRNSKLHQRLRRFSETSDDLALMSTCEPPRPNAPPLPEVSQQEREIRIMRRLGKCPHVVHLREAIDDEEENMVHLILTLADGGSITHAQPYDIVKKYAPCVPVRPLTRVRSYGQQLLKAMMGLQEQRIIHNDIKPDNVLLSSDGSILLSDFGESVLMPPAIAMNPNASVSAFFSGAGASLARLSRMPGQTVDEMSAFSGLANMCGFDPGFMPDSSMFLPPSVGKDGKLQGRGAVGTPAFSAPELVENNMCSYASDAWSFGVLLYAMVFGRLPFAAQSVVETYKSILSDPLVFPARESLPEGAALSPEEYETWVAVCESILVRNPLQRPTAASLARMPLFAGAPPPVPHPECTSAAAASQKVLNAVLSAKEHGTSPFTISMSGPFPSPLQCSSSGFLTEAGHQGSAPRGQLPGSRAATPARAVGISTSSILARTGQGVIGATSSTVSNSSTRRSKPPLSPVEDVEAQQATPTLPTPPPLSLSRIGQHASTTSATSAHQAKEEPVVLQEEHALGSTVSVLLSQADSPLDDEEEDEATALLSSEGVASPMTVPTTRISRAREIVQPREPNLKHRNSCLQTVESGPIVTFLAESQYMDTSPSTTARRLQRSTATTAAYNDEDPFGSRISSRAGGLSMLGSHATTSTSSSMRADLTDGSHTAAGMSHLRQSSCSSINTTGTAASFHTAASQSLVHSEDAPRGVHTHRAMEAARALPEVFTPRSHKPSAADASGASNSSMTSFRDPTSGSSITSSVTPLASSRSSRQKRAKPVVNVQADGRRGRQALMSEISTMHNASFNSVPLSSDADVASVKSQQPHPRHRGRRRDAPTVHIAPSSDEDELCGFGNAEEATAPLAEGSPCRITKRDPARVVHVSAAETQFIRSITGDLYPITDSGIQTTETESTNNTSDTVPPPSLSTHYSSRVPNPVNKQVQRMERSDTSSIEPQRAGSTPVSRPHA